MPEVPLVATGPFTYRTRRLMAGDEFSARNPLDARILTRVRKVAEEPKPVRRTAKVEETPTKGEVPAISTKPAAKPAAKKAPAKKAKKAAAKK